MPMTKQLSSEDCEICIRYFLDRSEDANTRVAAAERLMYCIGQTPKDALFKVLVDDSEPDYIREEAAGSLGSLWAESEVEYERLIQIQPPLLDEVLCDFDLYEVKLNKSRLGKSLDLFMERYFTRSFMA
ncbi:hypothetical protein MHN79_08365 [Vibrio sp. Of14-4]|uniref:hypothetical protein n=1 Tax=Vibrio sp. Of14-4 TaxID=2724878 RepID=UPI001EF3053D|nr:hypothetical protein [Vibrio sp. Of14-4]MCG7489503.1 hypothetical protein [Vibrio sp. Of14-4]